MERDRMRSPLMIVIGVGGVGSHCAHALVRAGVRRLRLVDFDRVSLSSLNRHAVATRQDVGISKVLACAQWLRAIAPGCFVDAREEMFTASRAKALLLGDTEGYEDVPAIVVDCIDDVPTKADLLQACLQFGLRVVSALGSGAKGDPVRLCVGRGLRDITNDNLATKLRQLLRMRGADVGDIPFVYSSQKAVRALLPLTDEQRASPENFGNVANFRIRVIPVLGTQPALAGVTVAAQALAELARPAEPLRARPSRTPQRQLAERFLDILKKREAKMNQPISDVTSSEALFLLHEVWKYRSSLDEERVMGNATGVKFVFTRWDPARPPGLANLIFCQEEEMLAHTNPSAYPPKVRDRVEAGLTLARKSLALLPPREFTDTFCVPLSLPEPESPPPSSRAPACPAVVPGWAQRNTNGNADSAEEGLITEQLSRNSAFFGEDGVGHELIRNSFIVIVGAGASGSMAASLLVRAGVSRLRLVDDALVVGVGACHAMATAADAGRSKVAVCKQRLAMIMPSCMIDGMERRFDPESATEIFGPFSAGGSSTDQQLPSLVIDCVGGVASKSEVLVAAVSRGLRVVTAVASPGLTDPTRLALAPLAEVHACPISVALRLAVSRRLPANDSPSTIDVVHSHEPTPWARCGSGTGRTWGAPFEPLVRLNFGLSAAAKALHILAGEELPEAPAPGTVTSWKRVEKKLRKDQISGVNLDLFAIGCLLEHVWRGRSALGRQSATVAALELVRWDVSKPAGLANLVPLTKEEAAEHEAATDATGSLPDLSLPSEAERFIAAEDAENDVGEELDLPKEVLLRRRRVRAQRVIYLLGKYLDVGFSGRQPQHPNTTGLTVADASSGTLVPSPAIAESSLPWSLRGVTTQPGQSGLQKRFPRFAVVIPIVLVLLSSATLAINRCVAGRLRWLTAERPTLAAVIASAIAWLKPWERKVGIGSVASVAVPPTDAVAGGTAGHPPATALDRHPLPHVLPDMGSGFAGLVGQTPLVELRSLSEATGCRILAKAEFLSPGGCQKDRVARQILDDAAAAGLLRPGGTVVEGTSGSTGISLALAAVARGYRVVVVMPDDQAAEKMNLLRRFGAELVLVRPASISSPDHYVNVAKRRAAELAVAGGGSDAAFFADQFENPANFRAHFHGTGPELWAQSQGRLDAFVMSAGTGGTVAGVGCFLKSVAPNVHVCLADVQGSALYNKVTHGVLYAAEQAERVVRRHRTDTIAEGIGIDRLTANLAKGLPEHNGGNLGVDSAVRVSDQEALDMAHFVLAHEGLFIGSSAAVNCAAACKVAQRLGVGKVVATVLCDSGHRHLTKFYNPEVWPEFLLEAPVPRVRGDLSFLAST
eukprot:TRINITY_DN55455_c0_g1_i1.p1 TRINITY_DN55455_c0_g1~~TRINITY_DN55455_c0_g1_i1.p1  ORF type:complete len:1342 (-),score=241.34 TRINITY_DN55455_c0_g1_i1:77-4102(-)